MFYCNSNKAFSFPKTSFGGNDYIMETANIILFTLKFVTETNISLNGVYSFPFRFYLRDTLWFCTGSVVVCKRRCVEWVRTWEAQRTAIMDSVFCLKNSEGTCILRRGKNSVLCPYLHLDQIHVLVFQSQSD